VEAWKKAGGGFGGAGARAGGGEDGCASDACFGGLVPGRAKNMGLNNWQKKAHLAQQRSGFFFFIFKKNQNFKNICPF